MPDAPLGAEDPAPGYSFAHEPAIDGGAVGDGVTPLTGRSGNGRTDDAHRLAQRVRALELEISRHASVERHLRDTLAHERQAHALERERAEAALRESETRLAAELSDATLLQTASAHLIQEQDVEALYDRILDAAAEIMRSDFASMQMLYRDRGESGELRLLGFRGFDADAARFWEWVRADSDCTCGEALRSGTRVIAPNVEESAFMAGTDDLVAYRRAGIRSAQSTPLVSRDGRILGMLSTHWREPHQPSERELRMLDILVRQAADLLERMQVNDLERDARKQAQAARADAVAANRAKSDFLAAMSHELRTPLNAIAGHAQLLQMGLHGPITDAQREALARLQASGQHLLSLINDVLNFAKVEAGRMTYRLADVQVAEVVAELTPMIAPQIEARQLTYEMRDTHCLSVRADRDRLRQILLNLVSNAVKFTDAGGRVTVSASPWGDGQAGFVALQVADTGCGIPADKLASVFDPFVQVHRNLTRTTEGTGLGLSISRDLARGMGGDLTALSELGTGSTFTLTLPTA